MDLRRTLLLLALTMIVVAGVSSLFGPPPAPDEPLETAPTAPAEPSDKDEPARVRFQGSRGGVGEQAPRETVRPGTRVILTGAALEPGLVEVEGFGRLAPAGPGTPAVFDLVADEPGHFDAVFRPTDGLDRLAGTLVVRGSGKD